MVKEIEAKDKQIEKLEKEIVELKILIEEQRNQNEKLRKEIAELKLKS